MHVHPQRHLSGLHREPQDYITWRLKICRIFEITVARQRTCGTTFGCILPVPGSACFDAWATATLPIQEIQVFASKVVREFPIAPHPTMYFGIFAASWVRGYDRSWSMSRARSPTGSSGFFCFRSHAMKINVGRVPMRSCPLCKENFHGNQQSCEEPQ
jgi:hypothetical protein